MKTCILHSDNFDGDIENDVLECDHIGVMITIIFSKYRDFFPSILFLHIHLIYLPTVIICYSTFCYFI